MVTAVMKLKSICSFEEKLWQTLRIKKQSHYFADKGLYNTVKAMVFAIVMYRCESWLLKKAESEELMLLNCGVEEDS